MKERGNFWMRFFDRYAGIPIVWFLSLVKRANKAKGGMNSILVIKIGAIGDTLLLAPVLKAIKNAHPKASLTVIGSKNNYEVLNRYSFIDSLKTFEVSKVIKEPSYFFRFMKDVNSREYDVVMDFESWPRLSAIVAFFVGTGRKIGFRTKAQFKHLIFDAAVPHDSSRHEIENYMSLANAIGVGTDPQLKISGTSLKSVPSFKIKFPIQDSEKIFVEDLFKRENFLFDNLILLHPWSSGYKGHLKEWGAENFARLAGLLAKDGYIIGITGTKDNQLAAGNIVNACPDNVISFCGRFTLGQTAYLIKKSRLLITVNTGIMHLGAALNHPMIALHGPAGVVRWGPVGSSNACNIESDFACAPCLNLGFEYPCKHGGCMDAIKVETVLQKAHEILQQNNATKESLIAQEAQSIH
ncbi:MAG: glycosyltransferase family 9 protein [Deltaproteobacteria bacterium]|nr:glycosyltransferase family 9 protein [Deltaproteobacteria bacterium]